MPDFTRWIAAAFFSLVAALVNAVAHTPPARLTQFGDDAGKIFAMMKDPATVEGAMTRGAGRGVRRALQNDDEDERRTPP